MAPDTAGFPSRRRYPDSCSKLGAKSPRRHRRRDRASASLERIRGQYPSRMLRTIRASVEILLKVRSRNFRHRRNIP